MADQTQEVLRKAQGLEWTCIRDGGHWKLIPPGALCPETPRPMTLSASPSDPRSLTNFVAQLRRYGQHGPALAEAIAPRGNGHQPKQRTNGHGPHWIEPERTTVTLPPDQHVNLAEMARRQEMLRYLLSKAQIERHPTQTDVVIKFWAFNDDAMLLDLLDLAEGES